MPVTSTASLKKGSQTVLGAYRGASPAYNARTFYRDFAGSKTLNHGIGPAINFTRGTNATFFDASGTLRFAPSNAIRNSQAGGATAGVIGSGGVIPTNWGSATGALSFEVVGTGTSLGLSYIDLRVSGTTTTFSTGAIYYETTSQVVASKDEVWTGSHYVALIGGSSSNINTFRTAFLEYDNANAVLTSSNTNFVPTASLTRYTATRTLTESGTARLRLGVGWTHALGVAVDFTLRIAAPQLEQNATASTYIPTTGTANFDQPRFDHDPATAGNPSRGLLIEEARTNSIRNSQAGGAATGTPGTLPTNWSSATIPHNLTREIVATGTINGMAYVDVRYSGTTNTTSGTGVFIEPAGVVAASPAQAWSASAYLALVGGTLDGTNGVFLALHELNSTTVLATLRSSSIKTTISSSLRRFSAPLTTTDATITHVRPFIEFNYSSGAVIDLTLRIAAPQLEQGAFPTSYIPTTTAAATRSADSAVVTPISSFYNQAEGTLFAEGTSNVAPNSLAALVSIDDTTANERIQIRRGTQFNLLNIVVVDGGNSQATLDTATSSWASATEIKRIALALKADDLAVSMNGATALTDTSATLPTVTRMIIGLGPNSQYANGHIRKLAYYPRRLSNTLLQQLTT